MWRTLAFGLALIAVASQVKAGSPEECAKFRQTILEMEKTSVRPPGWVMFDTQLRTMYAQKCLLSPTRARAAEYWYRADGTPLGIPGDYAPPEQGGYTTTPEIAAYCANSTNPSLCALAKGIEAACANPVDTQERNYCAGILAGQVPTLPQPSEPLPRIADLLGPARATAPQLADAQLWADPGFQRMCAAANANFNTCTQRRQNMTTMGQGGLGGGSSQAGAFQECQQVYSSVLNMCQATKLGAAQPTGQRPVTPAPKPAPQQPTHQQSARPADGSSRSVSPDPNEARKQQLLSQMPAQCRNELNALFQGADTGDRAKALTAYDSLRGQQCNGAMQTLAGTTGLGMPERVMTPRSQRLVDRAMAGDEGIVPGRAADAAAQGGGSYDIGQILDFGIALLGAMNGVAGVYVPSAGGAYASRMGSIGNRAVHSTYGQGAPIRPAPRTGPSDITGTK